MSELSAIVSEARRLREEGREYFMATVVCVEGSSYRKPGARMLICDDRWIAGSVSGGCLEHDVVRKSWWLARDGQPRVVTYDSMNDEGVASALGCQGVVHVLVEPAGGPADPLDFIARCFEEQSRGAIATVIRSAHPRIQPGARVFRRQGELRTAVGLGTGAAGLLDRECVRALDLGRSFATNIDIEERAVEVFVENVAPPPRLFVFGAGHDAVPLVTLGLELGWEVFVCDRSRERRSSLFPAGPRWLREDASEIQRLVDGSSRPVAVVMNHHVARDRSALALLLTTRVRYIGCLGPRQRTERLLREIARPDAGHDPRLHAPVGLAIGAETPQEIALSIVAEIQSTLTRSRGESLNGMQGPIHGGIAA